MPKIEEAYGAQVYTHALERLQGAHTRIAELEGALVEANHNIDVLQGQLDRAISKITQCFRTFHADEDAGEIIGEVLGV